GRTLLKAADEQVRGTAIDRHVVDIGLGARSLEDRFVIAGDEAGILAEPRDLQRDEMLLEEGACLGAVGNLRSPRRAAGLAQRNPQRLCSGRQRVFRSDRPAACAKRPVSREMIVVAPAGDVGPGERDILAVADLERKGETRIGNRARIAKMMAWGACRWHGK